MSDLNERAAKAMGYKPAGDDWCEVEDKGTKYFKFSPEHDRNAAHELLIEVGRRGLVDEYSYRLSKLIGDTNIEKPLSKRVYEYQTAPLELIVTAACEVLESQ